MKKIFFAITLLLIQNCSYPNWYKPSGYLFSKMPKGGSPGYNLGWTHGCQSALGSQFAGSFFMSFYSWSRDPDISSSNPNIEKIRQRYGKKELKDINWNDLAQVKANFADYNQVFWEGHYFCRQTSIGTAQMAGMNPPLPGETRYNPAAHHLGSIYKLDGKNDPRWGSPVSGGFW